MKIIGLALQNYLIILKIYNELTDIVINQMQDHTKHFQEIQIKIEKNEDE